jgi:hypothetical protein
MRHARALRKDHQDPAFLDPPPRLGQHRAQGFGALVPLDADQPEGGARLAPQRYAQKLGLGDDRGEVHHVGRIDRLEKTLVLDRDQCVGGGQIAFDQHADAQDALDAEAMEASPADHRLPKSPLVDDQHRHGRQHVEHRSGIEHRVEHKAARDVARTACLRGAHLRSHSQTSRM